MMRAIILSILLSLAFLTSLSQGRDNYWALGYSSYGNPLNGGVTILYPNNNPLVFSNPRDMWFDFTNASICNDTGNFLFYTNGVYIANIKEDTMLNGSGLNPSFYTTQFSLDGLRLPQADIIIPVPSNDSLLALIHITEDLPSPIFRPLYAYYSIININGDSGSGEVIKKNQIIFTDTLFNGMITVSRHGNGRDWWIIVPEYGDSLGFYTILLSPDTFQIVNHQYFSLNGKGIGQACFTPDGTKYIISYWYGNAFFDFDRCNGTLTYIDKKVFSDSLFNLGASISPNSRYAYFTHGGQQLLQYDLQAPNIVASETVVATLDTFQAPQGWYLHFWMHQIAPDGKIYINTTSTTMAYHRINYPDSAGLACDVEQHAIIFPHFNATIPNFPNYNLGPLLGSVCDSLGLGVAENAASSFNIRINPNPCSNYFYLNYDIATNKNLLFVLYDSFGKEVLRRNLYGTTKYLLISTQGLSDGVYFGVVSSDTSQGFKRETMKVVVIKN